jgi:ankyrin repeat protein
MASIFELAANGDIVELEKCTEEDVNVLDEYGRTPLCYAIKNKHLDCVRYLVNKRKACVDAIPGEEQSPLYWAVWKGGLECLKFLVESGAKCDNEGALNLIASHGMYTFLVYLVENGANVNSCREEDGWRPIHGAARYGHLKCLLYLVEKGTDLNVVTRDHTRIGHTPLSLAISYEQPDIHEHLIKHGACINGSPGSKSPLKCAIDNSLDDMVEWLLSKGADPFNDITAHDLWWDMGIRQMVLDTRKIYKGRLAIQAMVSVKTHRRLGYQSSLTLLSSDIIRRLHTYVV